MTVASNLEAGTHGREPSPKAGNKRMLQRLLVVVVGMFGFGFALIPFYNKICEVAGLRNVIAADAMPVNTQVDMTRNIDIEFDSNLKDLPWDFKPVSPHTEVHPGAVNQVMFEVRNHLDVAVTGQAVPSYAPRQAVGYFKKIECFCFTSQTLQPHEVRQMPVVFVVDPALPKNIDTITLSYTFFEVNGTRAQKPG
jgi:cytochrome c oxidase assembly protein subunit 11